MCFLKAYKKEPDTTLLSHGSALVPIDYLFCRNVSQGAK